MDENLAEEVNSGAAPLIRGRTGGWIKAHRCLLDHPRFTNGDWLKLWLWLLLKTTHQQRKVIFGGRRITLQPGQLITSRQKLSERTGIEVSKVERLLKSLQIEQQIEQQSSNASRLLTIVNWSAYQRSEQPIDQPANNGRTADEQPVNTNKKEENAKNDRSIIKTSRTQPTARAQGRTFSAETIQTIYEACPLKSGLGPSRSEVIAIRKALVEFSRYEPDPVATMLERVNQYAYHVSRQPPNYIKSVLNYFRDEHFRNVFKHVR